MVEFMRLYPCGNAITWSNNILTWNLDAQFLPFMGTTSNSDWCMDPKFFTLKTRLVYLREKNFYDIGIDSKVYSWVLLGWQDSNYHVTYCYAELGQSLYFSEDAKRCNDGLVQERCNSIANALELHLSWTNPLLWSVGVGGVSD